jgi:hypothetical protein
MYLRGYQNLYPHSHFATTHFPSRTTCDASTACVQPGLGHLGMAKNKGWNRKKEAENKLRKEKKEKKERREKKRKKGKKGKERKGAHHFILTLDSTKPFVRKVEYFWYVGRSYMGVISREKEKWEK